MKMTKKIALAALAALAFVFTGCLPDGSLTDIFQKNFGPDIFHYSDNDMEDGLGKWTIEETNENANEYVRGMQFLQTKHSDIAGLVRITGKDAGVVGLAFNVTQNKDKTLDNYKTYNFCLVGIQNNSAKGPRYYVSYFANVSADDMVAENFGAHDGTKAITKTAVDPDCMTPYEIDLSNGWIVVNKSLLDEDGNLAVVLDVDEISSKDAAADTYGAGTYFVNVYKTDAYNEKGMKFNKDKDDYLLSTTKVDAKVLGKEKDAQAKVGVYANVYGEQTLTATVKIADLTNDAIAE